MPVRSYSNKIVFHTINSNTKDITGTKTTDHESVDFALKMTNAIDVQLIDTNLYMSKELWLPYGSRGAFGGQVNLLTIKLHKQ
jgi:hypothetical protein